ncbi:MAG: tetratricopeptide repeat protein [Gammaproteobacteria bacterium]|nr:tetratricopeptide repeat protein [Gammaproteobacteria bacterium]
MGAILVAAFTAGTLPAIAENCGPVPLPGAAGPYDYVDSKYSWNLNDINQNHWVPAQRELQSNRVQWALYQLNYLLIRVPNHYPALFELGKIQQQHPGITYIPALAGKDEVLEFSPTPECYFDRAFRYRPNDPTLVMLFGLYYHQIKDLDKAVIQYRKAESMDPESSEIQYNLGLVYFDLKDYESSHQHAKRAYDLGYPLAGLRKKLKAVGEWPATGD